MSGMKISSTQWLAISLRNGLVALFDLNETNTWQCLPIQPIVDRSHEETVLMKFSPNGRILVVYAQHQQLNLYNRSDFETTEVWWQSRRIVPVPKPILALNLTNTFLLIADTDGDLYEIDLSFQDVNANLVMTAEKCITRHPSPVLDIVFIQTDDAKPLVLLADRDKRITRAHYPDVSNNQRHCLGHSDAVSHIKVINNDHILSASDDGTLRLWRVSDCIPLVLFHSKAFLLSSKQLLYTQLYDGRHHQTFEDYCTAAMPIEPSIHLSSTFDYSIWKVDVTCYSQQTSDMYVAFSVSAHRYHSIYLTTLTNMRQLTNKQRRLTLDSSYGKIVDYCFPFHGAVNNNPTIHFRCDLYVLFDSYTLLKIDVISILSCSTTGLSVQSDSTLEQINHVLAEKESYSIYSITTKDDISLPQLFDRDLYDSNSRKRQHNDIEEEQRKKLSAQSKENDDAPLVVNI